MAENTTDTNPAAADPAGAPGADSRGRRKTRVGVVLSDKMDKTIVVGVVRRVPHPKFHKIVKKTTKLYAEDANGLAKTGDRVRVMECRPLSKMKRWRLVEVLTH